MLVIRVVMAALLLGLVGCDEEPGGVDAGSIDAGSVDAGSVDAGSVDAGSVDAGSVDAGSVDAGSVDAGPSPVTLNVTAESAWAECVPPSPTNRLRFVMAIQYFNSDPAMDYDMVVESVTLTLDQDPMTALDVTWDVVSATLPADGMIILRHGAESTDPVLPDPCSLCGAGKTVTYEVRISAAGTTHVLTNSIDFVCMTTA